MANTPEISGPLTILELRASNVKRISVVRVKPDGSIVQITGKNGNGKSSVLDSIWMALDWKNSVKPAQPIRKGANEAMIKLDMGEIKVTRTFRKNAKDELVTELRLENASGANISSPQTILDRLIGALSFEPLEFMKGDDKAKYEAIRSFVPGVDFDLIERQNETDFAKRTDENRRAKDFLAQAAGIIVPEKIEAKRIDVAQVVADLEKAEEENKEIANRRIRRATAEENLKTAERTVERLTAQIADLQATLATNQEYITAMGKKLADAGPLPDEVDTAALRAEITRAQTVNTDIDKNALKQDLLSRAEQHEAAAKALTAAMDARNEDMRAKIAAAEMPIPGLTLKGGKVYLDDIEIRDVNRAEQLKLSMAVAMAKNPTIKVIRITEGGNDLDEDSMAVVRKMAEENGFQVWLERIHAEGGPPAVIMEDGHAKE